MKYSRRNRQRILNSKRNLCTTCTYVGRAERDQYKCCVTPSNPIVLDKIVEDCDMYVKRTGPMLTVRDQDEKYGNKYFGGGGKRNG